MPTDIYLKKELQTNVPMLLTIVARKGSYPEKDYTTKDPIPGKYEHLYIFRDSLGRELKHYAKDREEETLKLFKAGEAAQVVRQEAMKEDKRITFLTWTPPEGTEARAAAAPQPRSNTGVETQKRNLEAQRDEEERKWRKIDLSKIVFGYMNTALAQGKTPEQAAALAVECYELQEKTVGELFTKHFPA